MKNGFSLLANRVPHRWIGTFEWARMTRHLLLSMLLTASLCGLAAAAEMAWPTTHFEVVVAKPDVGGSPADKVFRKIYDQTSDSGAIGEQEDGPYPLAHDQQVALEQHLHEAALQLQAWGFPPPFLKLHIPMINRREGVEQVYHLFLFEDADPEVSGHYRTHFDAEDCSFQPTKIPHIALDTGDWVQVPVLNDVPLKKPLTRLPDETLNNAMVTATHELFHAVQFGTAMKWDQEICDPPVRKWITEGTADAVGHDLVRMLRGERALRYRAPAKRWGRKKYSDNLESIEATSHSKYRSSSFWRYLAELSSNKIGAAKNGVPATKPGPKPGKTDYSYLARFFSKDDVNINDVGEQIKWLHKSLEDDPSIGVGLDRVLPDFYSVYSDYGGHRQKYGNFLENEVEWRNLSFGSPDTCPELTLTGDQMSASARLLLLPRAGRCFSIKRGSDVLVSGVRVTATITAPSETGGWQLALGESGGRRVEQDQEASGRSPDGKAWNTKWTWVLEDRDPLPMVITNVASTPWNTIEQWVDVSVGVTGVDSTMTNPDAVEEHSPGSTPGNEKEPEAGPAGTKSAASRTANQQRRKVKAIDPLAARAKRTIFNGDCPGRDKAMNRCGDQLVVKLELVPGVVSLLGTTMETGGVLKQMIGVSRALNEQRDKSLKGFAQMDGEGQAEDGNEIIIRVPLVDYGFTGTFNNAQMQVSAAEQGDYRAIGPEDIDGTGAHLFPPSGQVTIDEYTPTMLRGTFRASLIAADEFSAVTTGLRYARERKPTLEVARTIEGRFWVAAPWQTDDRYEVVLNPDMQQSVADDLSEMMPAGLPFGIGATTAPPAGLSGDGPEGYSCTCSCDEFAELEKISDGPDGEGSMTAAQMDMYMCGMQCGIEYSKCYAN